MILFVILSMLGLCQSQATLINSILESISDEFGANCASIITTENDKKQVQNFDALPTVHVHISDTLASSGNH